MGEFFEQARFANEGVGAMLEADRATDGAIVSRGYERAHCRVPLPEQFDQLEAVKAWHLQIGDDEVWLEAGSQGETIRPVFSLPCDSNLEIGGQ